MRSQGNYDRGVRLVALIAAFAAATVALPLAAGPAAPAAGISWTVALNPFRIDFRTWRGPLVSQATAPPAGPGSRMAYTLASGATHTLTKLVSQRPIPHGVEYTVATDEARRTATVDVTQTPHDAHVSWRLHPATGVAVVYEALRTRAPAEHFVGAGIDHFGVDLAGQIVQLKVSYSCSRSIVTPFYASSAGYGAYFETSAVGHIEFRGTHDGMACLDSNKQHALCPLVSAPDRVEVCFKTDGLAYDVFAGTPEQVLADYRLTAGHAAIPQLAQLGTIKWRDRVTGSAQLLADAAEFRRLGIPLRTILLDNPWETGGCNGPLTFDRTRFPDPAGLIRSLHGRGLDFMVWVSTHLSLGSGCPRLSGYPAAAIVPTRPPLYNLVDLTSAAGRTIFERKIEALVRLGVDGFKGDRGDEDDLEGLAFAHGRGTLVHNAYPALVARDVLAAARAAGERAPLTMFRAATGGTVAAGANVWAGDQRPDWNGLQDAIWSLASLGASGFPVAGSDIGGYGTLTGQQILTTNVFARWSQLGAISPIFEVGGADRAATFWQLGPQAVSAFRDAALLHYALVPYLYGLERASARTGSPILAPLGLLWPGDERAWSASLELMVGPDLLAAPVTNPGGVVDVYLPQGAWTDLYGGTPTGGGQTLHLFRPLSRFPLYLRTGAAIPFDLRAPVWPRPWPLDALSLPGRGGWLYAPGGGAVTAAAPGHGTLTASTHGGVVTVTLTGAPRESEVLLASRGAHVLTIDGRAARELAWQTAARGASGWLSAGKPFTGVLVKLTTRGGRATFSFRSS